MPVATVCVVVLIAVISTKGGELSNKYCPVTTSELAEEQFFVDYQDRQIYFCCNKCKKEFLNNPEAYLANLESAEADSSQSVSSHDHDVGAYEHGERLEKVAVAGGWRIGYRRGGRHEGLRLLT